MGLRRFDLRLDMGRTKYDIRRIVTAFADGDPLWIRDDGKVYDSRLKECIGCAVRICFPGPGSNRRNTQII